MGGLLSRRAVVAAQIEATPYTAATLAAADANFLVVDPKYVIERPMFERKNVDASMSQYAAVAGNQAATLTFKVESKGSGTAGTAPALGKLLKACGMGETIVALASATYKPISTGFSTVTIALYKDGTVYKMRGARGTFKFTVGKGGEPGMFEFTFKGVHVNEIAGALLVGSGLETTLPPAFLNAAFQLQTYAAKIDKLTLDIGNVLTLGTDPSQAEGFYGCQITDRKAIGSCDPEWELPATHDFEGIWKAGTLGNLNAVFGATAGNILTVTAPKLQYLKFAPGSRSGIEIITLDFMLTRNATTGDDELSLAYT